MTAGHELALTACWLDVGVELDPRLLLGDLLADGGRPWIGLLVDGVDVVVSPSPPSSSSPAAVL
jgi:hypothetical protein